MGFTILGEIFAYVTVCDRFLNPTIEIVRICLRGWCMLGVFLLPAFTHLGHEHQDLFSLCDGIHVFTDSHPKEFLRNGVRTHINSKGKVPSTRSSEEDRNFDTASSRTASPTHYRLNYSGPHSNIIIQTYKWLSNAMCQSGAQNHTDQCLICLWLTQTKLYRFTSCLIAFR